MNEWWIYKIFNVEMSVKMTFKTEIFINRKIINDQTDYSV